MKKYYIIALAIVSIVMLGAVIVPEADANPSELIRSQTAAATSTLVYMTPGTATTTLTFDAGDGAFTAPDSAVLLVQYTASSTSPVLNAALEYSQNKIDWYPASTVLSTATTTLVSGAMSNFQWISATSTVGAGSGTASRVHQSVSLGSIPTRYARVKFYVPAGGGNGALWAEIVAKKQYK